jgi:hypothetical protein
MTVILFCAKALRASVLDARKFTLSIFFYLEEQRVMASAQFERVSVRDFLEGHDAVNAICAENAELALVITAKVDKAATSLSGAG